MNKAVIGVLLLVVSLTCASAAQAVPSGEPRNRGGLRRARSATSLQAGDRAAYLAAYARRTPAGRRVPPGRLSSTSSACPG
ncbi:MAG: hypothetical protein M0C28_15325 [Candidatus Moduliflexus flocculans]|nr:hypothetical protein [Candidatus Moduliflexus flocculans]